MSRKRLGAIVAGLVIVLALIGRVVLGSHGDAGAVTVDTRGASGQPAVSPAASPSVPVAAKPLVVLNPRTVHQGGSIGVWGSGFPSGATVALYLKQDLSDNVNPVSVVEADQSGQFGGVNVTVSESVSSGGLIVEAKDRARGIGATAEATVLEGAEQRQPEVQAAPTAQATDQPQATATPQPQATATPQPQATATSQRQGTATPQPQATATAQPQAIGTPQSTSQPKATEQPTGQPQPTAQPKATEQPQATEQPKPTAQPKATEQTTAQRTSTPQPKPTEQPKPKPTEQPKPSTSSAPSSYTVQSGDSLSAIAEHVYGNANDWRSLYDANRGAIGDNPNVIHPGTELVIPPSD